MAKVLWVVRNTNEVMLVKRDVRVMVYMDSMDSPDLRLRAMECDKVR